MTHTRRRPPGVAPTLRRETVSTVAALAHEDAFGAMSAYPSFGFASRAAYLRHLGRHLDRLVRTGGQVRVGFFEPREFAAYCVRHRIEADSAEARSRYAAEEATAGATVPYTGQPVRELLRAVRDAHERQVTYEVCADLLADCGRCRRCGASRAGCVLREAEETVAEVVRRAGPGVHRLVCSLLTGGGPASAAAAYTALGSAGEALSEAETEVETAAEGSGAPPRADGPTDPGDAALLRLVLAAALAQGEGGGLVLRTVPEAGDEGGEGRAAARAVRVSGWALSAGRFRPLSEAEVFAACCTEPGSGDPLPPEHGVVHRAATELPDYRCGSPAVSR